MNYQWGSTGSRDYAKALVACCMKGKPHDWPATKGYAEAALAKDPQHIGARWLLGTALAQQGDHAAAVEHLVAAIAADWGRYGAALGEEKDLEPFLATPHGAAVRDLIAKIGDDYRRRAASGLWVVARRSPFRWPDKPGAQYSTSRGELYAYDRESRRYLRLTHTNDSVVGFVRSSAGNEVAVIGFDKIETVKSDDAPPTIAHAFAYVIDTKDWRASPRIVLPTGAREVAIGYGVGDQLLIATAQPQGRWETAAAVVYSADRSGGKLTKTGGELPATRVVFSLEEGRVVRPPDDSIKAAWSGEPATAPALEVRGRAVMIRESGLVAQASLALGETHLAFATAVDPCATDTAPSLYVANTKTGALKHLLTAKSRFTTRWVAPTLLAYEDGDGTIRLWDSTLQREIIKLDNKAGIALDVLSLAPAPLCKGGKPPVAAGSGSAGSGSDELPPEE